MVKFFSILLGIGFFCLSKASTLPNAVPESTDALQHTQSVSLVSKASDLTSIRDVVVVKPHKSAVKSCCKAGAKCGVSCGFCCSGCGDCCKGIGNCCTALGNCASALGKFCCALGWCCSATLDCCEAIEESTKCCWLPRIDCCNKPKQQDMGDSAPVFAFINTKTREEVDILPLLDFRFLKMSKHRLWSLEENTSNTIYLSKKSPRFTGQLGIVQQGVGHIILHFPLKKGCCGSSLWDDLAALGKEPPSSTPAPQRQNITALYTFHLRGEMGPADFNRFKKVIKTWSENQYAQIQGLDFVLQNANAPEINKRIKNLLKRSAAQTIEHLSISYAGFTNVDVHHLYGVLAERAKNLTALALCCNDLTEECLLDVAGCASCCSKTGSILQFVKDQDRFQKLLSIDLRGNPLGILKDSGKLPNVLAKRGQNFHLRLGFHSFDLSALEDTTNIEMTRGSGASSPFLPRVMQGLFSEHSPVLEDDMTIQGLGLWPEQLTTLLSFGAQPFVHLNLSGVRLPLTNILLLLTQANPLTLKKLTLMGTFSQNSTKRDLSTTDPTSGMESKATDAPVSDGDVKLTRSEEQVSHSAIQKRLKEFTLLTSLELGGNFALEDTTVIQSYVNLLPSFPNLRHFGFSGNSLGTLDLESFKSIMSLPALFSLDLSHNGLTNDHWSHLLPALQALTSLGKIDLSANTFSFENSTNIQPILKLLGVEEQGTLVMVPATPEKKSESGQSTEGGKEVPDVPYSELEAKTTQAVVKKSYRPIRQSALQVLDISGNTISADTFKEMKEFYTVFGDSRAPFAVLRTNGFSEGGDLLPRPISLGNLEHYGAMSQAIYFSRDAIPLGLLTTLPVLNLHNYLIPDQEMRVLSRMFGGGNLFVLNLGYVPLKPGYEDSIALILETNPNLISLNLSFMGWTTESLKKLIQPLSKLENLTTIDFSGNSFGGKGLKLMETPLKGKPLKNLSFRETNLTGKDAVVLQRLLPSWTVLRFLDLRDNRLGGRIEWFGGSEALASGLTSMISEASSGSIGLEALDLANNRFRSKQATRIYKGLFNHQNLRKFSIGFNPLGDKGAKSFGNFLDAHSSTVTDVSAPKIGLTWKGASDIRDPLSHLTRLEFLDLHNQGWGGDGQRIFGDIIQRGNVRFLLGDDPK